MRGIIIVNQELGHNAYKIKRFKEEFSSLNVDLDVVTNDGTIGKIENDVLVINLPKADFIIYLDKDIYLARELERAGYRLFNRADFIKLCDDKMLTSIACSNLGIRMPKTMAGPLVYSDINENNYSFLKTIEKEFSYPFVFKRVYGSLGEGVHLVNNYDDLKELYSKFYRQPILFQEYIKSSYGKSMRVLIIDGKVIGSFIRINHSDFRSNYGTTASSEKAENTAKYHAFAQNIADKLKIEYAGIDLLFDEKDEPILCEINSNAFFEEFEKVTRINVAKQFAEMVIKKIKYEQK